MATLVKYMTYDTQSFATFFNWCKSGISDAFNTFGWVSSNDGGCMNTTATQGTATITNIAITSNVVAVTVSTMTQSFTPGQTIQFSSVGTNTFLNGLIMIVQASPAPTTTTFSATSVSFSHANVGSAADTGTITAFTNWSTATAIPDTVPNAAAGVQNPVWWGQYRFRGPWQNTTGTFTNLQRINNQVIITVSNNTITSAMVGATLVITGVANANFSTNGSSSQMNLNSGGTLTPASGWPILAVTATTITINTLANPGSDIGSTSVSAGTGTPQYVGTNSQSVANLVPSDIVTYNGDVYIYSTTTLYGSSPIAPGTNSAGTNWRRIWYEIWKSNDALSSTNPLYFKIVYAQYAQTSTPNTPMIFFQFGSATDGAGNITLNYNWNAGPGLGTTAFAAATGPVSSLSSDTVTTTPMTGSGLWESDFSGASGRFTALLWRTFNVTASTPCMVINIERSKDNSGNDTDAYWTVIVHMSTVANNYGSFQQSIFKPGTGSLGIIQAPQGSTTLLPPITTLSCAFAQTLSNQIPFLPVFPMVGYVGNPMLNVISMKAGDAAEGNIVTATFYGTTHPYLISKVGNGTRGGPGNFGVETTGNAQNACGIRWE